MHISLSDALNAMILLTILMLIAHHSQPRATRARQTPCLRRRNVPKQHQPHAKNQAKPAWVKTELLRLLALMKDAGCRTIANTFNAKFAGRGISVSKTFVAQFKKKSRYDWLRLRKEFRKPPTPQRPNQTWALDFTDVHIGGTAYILIGVIDHGSRKNLALAFTDKSANSVLMLIASLTTFFGKPKALRTDNDGAFVSDDFHAGMKALGIRHQRSAPHSPWQNGRIERFFGTFKRAIRQIQIDSKATLQQAIDEFRFHYNHIRPHQNIANRTPEMAWTGKTRYPKCHDLRWFEAWDGVLCGWLYVPKAQRFKQQTS
jgi:putative transposase